MRVTSPYTELSPHRERAHGNARQMLDKYRQMQEAAQKEDLPDGKIRSGSTRGPELEPSPSPFLSLSPSISTVHHPPSTVYRLPFTIHRPPSTIHHPPSIVHRPPSIVHPPPSTVPSTVSSTIPVPVPPRSPRSPSSPRHRQITGLTW